MTNVGRNMQCAYEYTSNVEEILNLLLKFLKSKPHVKRLITNEVKWTYFCNVSLRAPPNSLAQSGYLHPHDGRG
jgi:hypothetical protein